MRKKYGLSLVMMFILSFIFVVPAMAIDRQGVQGHEVCDEYCIHSLYELILPEELLVAITGSGDVIFSSANGEYTIINSIADANATLRDPQIGDTLTVPTLEVDCNHHSENSSFLDEIEAVFNNPQIEYVLFTPANENEPIQMLATMEEFEITLSNIQVGDIITVPVHYAEEIVTYISMEEFNAMFSHLRMAVPFSCPGGWIRASSRIEARDYRFSHREGNAYIWVCFNHRVRVQFHCPCGRATMSSLEHHPGCGRRMVIR